ncbi:AraC family transcriptional regulator [Planomonospora sp. ID67723]|uniref:AraC family transcriptional regulator n=1 Tax=Planomonospora sp. ID67723 TaxID=2738134 RepID=UPI0018C3C561|nr:AraC family transcriptional regulator [Planomonospora sp. ID67723]MBG0829751.1 AraC family transcriptional regulator [Planomonospora sp. ID67723]
MHNDPVAESEGLLYFTDGSLAYAGRYLHHGFFPTHTHSFVEVAVVTGGSAVHHTTTGREPLSRGDAVLLRPGAWHGYEECDRLELYNCCFSVDLLHRELAWSREDALLGHLLWTGPYSMGRRGTLSFRLSEEALGECLTHLDGLDRLHARPISRHRGDIIGHLSVFLGNLARAAAQAREGAEEPAGPAHPAVVRAMRLMEARVAHDWTLTELADRLHLTPGYLVRLFKTATGLPPMAYLARQRVETAAALLLLGEEPIAQIGEQVGWGDPNYFARRFKAHFGMNPSGYRKKFTHRSVAMRDELR